MFASNESRFDRVRCDLSDIIGTPGNDDRGRVADRLSDATKLSWAPREKAAGLVVDAGMRGVGAFAAGAGEALASLPGRQIDEAVAPGGGIRRRPTLRSPSGAHQLNLQTLRNHRVVGGSYRLHTSAHGDVTLTGLPFGDLEQRDPGPPPRMRKAAVRGAMREQLQLSEDVDIELEKVVFPMQGGAVWAFLGRAVVDDGEQFADLRIHVRANDLTLLHSRDASVSSFWGEATAYPVSPGRTSNATAVRLPDLFDRDPGRLRGQTFEVRPNRGDGCTGPLRDWRHVPDADAAADEVNAYYHLSATAQWLRTLLGNDVFLGSPFTPLTVLTGHRGARNVIARFVPTLAAIHFGDNPRSAARSRDVCAHELMHAIVFATGGIDDVAPPAAQGLNEGYADFGQAAMLDDPRMGDWVAPEAFRDCSAPGARIPADPDGEANIYKLGTAWAGVMWDLRQDLGPEVGDLIALNSLLFIDETAGFPQALDALHASDRSLFPDSSGGGRHEQAIESAFTGRGG